MDEFVLHADLFDTTDDRYDVGELRPDALERLAALRATGSRIVVTGPITDTLFGTRALISRLVDLSVPFDEIDQLSRYEKKE